jgi:hypothetical protein
MFTLGLRVWLGVSNVVIPVDLKTLSFPQRIVRQLHVLWL